MAEDVLDRTVASRAPSAIGRDAPATRRGRGAVEPGGDLRSKTDLPGSLVARYGAEAPNVIAAAGWSGRPSRRPTASTSPEPIL